MTRTQFEKLTTALADELATLGFTRSRDRFWMLNGEEYLIVRLERLRGSDEEHLLVRAYVEISCDCVARFMGAEPLRAPRTSGEFVSWMGNFFTKHAEAWWVVEDRPDPEWTRAYVVGRGDPRQVAKSIREVVKEHVLPATLRYTSGPAIRDAILATGRGPASDWWPHWLLYMAILTARFGPEDQFELYAKRTLESRSLPPEHYAPLIERLRRGDFYAPGFAPGEKGKPKK